MHSWRQVPRTGTHRPRADRTHGVREGATRHLPRAPARRAGATASATGKGTPHTKREHGEHHAPQRTQRTDRAHQRAGRAPQRAPQAKARRTPTARTARATRQSGRNAPTARICAQGGGHSERHTHRREQHAQVPRVPHTGTHRPRVRARARCATRHNGRHALKRTARVRDMCCERHALHRAPRRAPARACAWPWVHDNGTAAHAAPAAP